MVEVVFALAFLAAVWPGSLETVMLRGGDWLEARYESDDATASGTSFIAPLPVAREVGPSCEIYRVAESRRFVPKTAAELAPNEVAGVKIVVTPAYWMVREAGGEWKRGE